ncbi:hypothetical protein BC830DRAFT_1049827, partial [Chytriomyces sp. MP71]
NIHATFWVIGANVVLLPDVLKATYLAGHQIGIHTWAHRHLTNLTDDQIVAELVYGAKAIKEVLGIVPKYYRPPYGDQDIRVRTLAAMMGLTTVVWSLDSQDWTWVGTPNITKVPLEFTSWAAQNVTYPISLEHDYWPDSTAMALKSMEILLAKGRQILPLSDCLG